MTHETSSATSILNCKWNDIEWNKDSDWRGIMSEEAFRTLQDRGCLDVSNLAPCNLQNDIHPIFDPENFIKFSAREHDFLKPALMLATRFIIEDEYQNFWFHILYGSARPRNRMGKSEEYLVPDAALEHLDASHRWNELKHVFRNLSYRVKFFAKSAAWSQIDGDESIIGEMFPDPESMNCKEKDRVDGDGCNECSYCQWRQYPLCPTCQNRAYHKWDRIDLINECRRLGAKQPSRLKKADLLSYLDAEYGKQNVSPRCDDPNERKLSDAPLHNIRIGILNDMHEPFKAPHKWSQTQHLRFQFSVAATLVHELVHAFWLLVSRRCWRCFDAEPWWSEHEHQTSFGAEIPELGNSWEYWAFGTRIPRVATSSEGGTKGVTANALQKGLWNYVWRTPGAGWAWDHDIVLPVDWIHRWFREETWQNIADKGRVEGRPGFEDAVILKETLVGKVPGSKVEVYRSSIEGYSHGELVGRGGFQ